MRRAVFVVLRPVAIVVLTAVLITLILVSTAAAAVDSAWLSARERIRRWPC